jgi:predicted membrane chloride channel (bestrophin family)
MAGGDSPYRFCSWYVLHLFLLQNVYTIATSPLISRRIHVTSNKPTLALSLVLLTVLGTCLPAHQAYCYIHIHSRARTGVVIDFVISYRAMTGYDRYWMG